MFFFCEISLILKLPEKYKIGSLFENLNESFQNHYRNLGVATYFDYKYETYLVYPSPSPSP
jgi:hypothetical protein